VIDQLTAVLAFPVTLALNCWLWPAVRLAADGVTEMLTVGTSVTVAVPVLVGSAILLAVTVTNCWLETGEGAMYNPAVLMVPKLDDVIDQLTPVLFVPVTKALNCWLWPAVRVRFAGVTETLTVTRFTVALARALGFATLVAITFTSCGLEMLAGAVYSPFESMVPEFGLRDQLTPVMVVPLTVATKTCCWLAPRVVVRGVIATVMFGCSVNAMGVEVDPPLVRVTLTGTALAIRFAGTATASSAAAASKLATVVTSGVPFQNICAAPDPPWTTLVALTVRVKPAPPAGIELGLREDIAVFPPGPTRQPLPCEALTTRWTLRTVHVPSPVSAALVQGDEPLA
jgi:hypothetical protein